MNRYLKIILVFISSSIITYFIISLLDSKEKYSGEIKEKQKAIKKKVVVGE
jgi:hypothetical protein